jgi:hypothetical protein
MVRAWYSQKVPAAEEVAAAGEKKKVTQRVARHNTT